MTSTARFLAIVISVLGTLATAAAIAQARPSIAALQSQIMAQQVQIATLESAPIQGLNGYVTMDLSTPSRPTLRVAGANLQVVNGLGVTGTVNGLGNVIVGYDETNSGLPAVCSFGQYVDQTSCTSGGGTWAVAHKSGSHNLVLGYGHRYSRYGGLLAGYSNTANGLYVSVGGGTFNTANGNYASVSGGSTNTASLSYASVSGGSNNSGIQHRGQRQRRLSKHRFRPQGHRQWRYRQPRIGAPDQHQRWSLSCHLCN